MKKLIILILILILVSACASSEIKNEGKMIIGNVNLDWLGHSTFKIKSGDDIVYTDPFILGSAADQATLILISHPHYDHCDEKKLAQIVSEKTLIITVPDCQSKLSSLNVKYIKLVKPGDKLKINNLELEAVPAYNTNKKFHPKQNEWVGFIITIAGKRIYYAGDTDLIPEMKNIKNIDVALLPIGGTFTMNYREAAQAANLIKPKIVIPMHYGSINLPDHSEEFKELVNSSKVEIL